MRITAQRREWNIAGVKVHLRRRPEGVVEISGDNWLDVTRGLGFAHTLDRQTQLTLVRLIGQGRLCECLHDSDETLEIDTFMRRLGFARLAAAEVERCSNEARAFAEAYAAGVNHALEAAPRPWEFRLARFRPEPWAVADTLLTILLMSYVGLAQTQQDLEKFLVQAIQAGVDVSRLKQLFRPHLEGLDDRLVALLRQVPVIEPLIPTLPAILPAITASNNWAVAPARSASGHALQCNDPHLECNRLPAVWYEAVLRTPEDYQLGASMPGVPGVIMGRTRHLSVGFTYGFMDMVDYFVEECRGNAVRRESGWLPLDVERETIWRKQHPAVEICVHRTEHGVIEADPSRHDLEDGLYLRRELAVDHGGTAGSLHVLACLPKVHSVTEGQKLLRQVSISGNWVLADREGHIGYQQSGLLPARQHSGLFPVPGWDSALAWQGLVDNAELRTFSDPPEGIIATANDDWNRADGPLAINLCQGKYRAERIAERLAEQKTYTLEDMQRLQADLTSTQARRYLQVLRPWIPNSPVGAFLANWDLRYDLDSRGATLFEAFYQRLLEKVFGERLFGTANWRSLIGTTNLMAPYFQRFDDALLGDDESWFEPQTREAVFREVLNEALAVDVTQIREWGAERPFVMRNLFFGGKLPSWLSWLCGLDRGPFGLPGGRATVVQGQMFRTHGRVSTFAPSWRYVTDLGTDEAYTALAGGPSDRIFSPWYVSDLVRWRQGTFKRITGID